VGVTGSVPTGVTGVNEGVTAGVVVVVVVVAAALLVPVGSPPSPHAMLTKAKPTAGIEILSLFIANNLTY
jgi:hypothetical protein